MHARSRIGGPVPALISLSFSSLLSPCPSLPCNAQILSITFPSARYGGLHQRPHVVVAPAGAVADGAFIDAVYQVGLGIFSERLSPMLAAGNAARTHRPASCPAVSPLPCLSCSSLPQHYQSFRQRTHGVATLSKMAADAEEQGACRVQQLGQAVLRSLLAGAGCRSGALGRCPPTTCAMCPRPPPHKHLSPPTQAPSCPSWKWAPWRRA